MLEKWMHAHMCEVMHQLNSADTYWVPTTCRYSSKCWGYSRKQNRKNKYSWPRELCLIVGDMGQTDNRINKWGGCGGCWGRSEGESSRWEARELTEGPRVQDQHGLLGLGPDSERDKKPPDSSEQRMIWSALYFLMIRKNQLSIRTEG